MFNGNAGRGAPHSFEPVCTPAVELVPSDSGTPLLWPVYAWRVVAPVPVARKLNVFQSAVLGLARAGMSNAADIGSQLDLDARLIMFVQGELRAFGWLDGRSAVTKAGERVLAADQAEPAVEESVGWVFTDPSTGNVWRWFVSGGLPDADLDYGEAGEPRRRQSKGHGPGQRIIYVRPSQLVARRPSADEVNKAVRAHIAATVGARRAAANDSDRRVAVSFVSDTPHPHYLLLHIHGESGVLELTGAPTGADRGALTAAVHRACESDKRLADLVRLALPGSKADASAAELQRRAEFEVETALTSAIRAFDVEFVRLVRTQRAWLEATAPRAPIDKLDDVIVKAQIAAECVLECVLSRWPLGGPLPFTDEKTMQALVVSLAESYGFLVPLPKSLLGVRAGKLVAASQSGGGLRPLLLLCVLAARADGHPLRRVAATHPRLLHEVNQLANVRDASAHAMRAGRKRRTAPDLRAEAESAVALVTTLARELLVGRKPGPGDGLPPDVLMPGGEAELDAVVALLRRQIDGG